MVPTRALGRSVVGSIVILIALTLPLTAGAVNRQQGSSQFSPSLAHQSPVAALNANDVGTFAVALHTSGSNHANAVDVTIYPIVRTLGGLAPVLAGQGVTAAAIANTGPVATDCPATNTTTVTVTLTGHGGAGVGPPTCGARPVLRLSCAGFACAGVYPLRITVTNGATTVTLWSLLAVTTPTVTTPVQLAQFFLSDPTSVPTEREETRTLAVLAADPSANAGVAVSYSGLSDAYFSTDAAAAAYRNALANAVASAHHPLFDAPPPSVDFTGLAAHKLVGDLASQVHLATQLASRWIHKTPSQWLVLSGSVSGSDLAALALDKVRDVVVPDADFSPPPTNTLQWGTPVHPSGAPGATLAVATTSSLESLEQETTIPAGLRADLTLGVLALLHFEAPFAPTPRTVVSVTALSQLGPAFLHDLLAGLAQDPLVTANGIPGLFRPDTVGADGNPTNWTTSDLPAPTWSSANVRTTRSLDAALHSFADSVTSLAPTTPLHARVLAAEDREFAGPRQRTLTAVQDELTHELDAVRVSETAINLAGAATSLPVTLTSRAPYQITGFVSLSARGVKFPSGSVFPFTLKNSTDEVRIPADFTGSGSFTLLVRFLTADRQLVIADGAVPVHNTATSVVGYVLTVVAVGVILLWWMRTSRRRPRGKHAR